MPTYEYKREDGTVFEMFQGINDEPLTTCPETGQNVKRLITGGAGVVYKGDGWYVTDYKRKEEQQGASSKANGSANSSKNGSSSTGQSSKTEAGSASESKKYSDSD